MEQKFKRKEDLLNHLDKAHNMICEAYDEVIVEKSEDQHHICNSLLDIIEKLNESINFLKSVR